jgi:hypothetical protein
VTFGCDALVYLYDTFLRATDPRETAVDLLVDLLDRTRSDNSPCESRGGRIKIIAVSIARTQQRFVEANVPFIADEVQRLFTLVGGLAADDMDDFIDIVTYVTGMLGDKEPPVDLPNPLISAVAHDAFVERAVAHGLAQCTATDGRAGLNDILGLLAELADRTADPEEIYIGCLRRAGKHTAADPETAVKLIEVVIDRLATADQSLDKKTRVNSLSAVTAAVLERTPVNIEPEPPFNTVVAAVEGLSEEDPALYDAVVVSVAEALESSAHGFDFSTAMAWREATGAEK